jgi:hypothetical protein
MLSSVAHVSQMPKFASPKLVGIGETGHWVGAQEPLPGLARKKRIKSQIGTTSMAPSTR